MALYFSLFIFYMLTDTTVEYEVSSGLCGIPEINSSITPRIVNGNVSIEGSWPWMVLIMENGEHTCGGSLISEYWILTAAHCMTGDIKSQKIYLGAHRIDASGPNAVEYIIQAMICHTDFDSTTFKDDICLIRLTESVLFNKYIHPVCLPPKGTRMEVGSTCIVTGWGDTLGTGSYYELRQAEVLVLDTDDCVSWYGEANTIIPENHLCAGYPQGGIDTCQGDSGGPLLHKESDKDSEKSAYVLRGVTSFGIGCAEKERPGVYVRVVEYVDWIEENIEAMSSNSCLPIRNNTCGGRIEESDVIIRNPTDEGSYMYPPNSDCSWEIVAPEGYYIQFIFLCYFLLSPAQDCTDYVAITYAAEGDSEIFCGNELPDPYIVENNSAILQFKTGDSLEYPGFVAKIQYILQPTLLETTTSEILMTSSQTSPEITTTSDVTALNISYIVLSMFIVIEIYFNHIFVQ